MGYGSKIKNILNEKNMTVTDLAKKANIPATTLYSIINKDSDSLNTDTLIKICNALDEDAAYVLLETQSKDIINYERFFNYYLLFFLKQASDSKSLDKYIDITKNIDEDSFKLILSTLLEKYKYLSKIDISGLSDDDIKELQNYADYLKAKRNNAAHSNPSTTE